MPRHSRRCGAGDRRRLAARRLERRLPRRWGAFHERPLPPCVVVYIPVFNDSKSAALLLDQLDAIAATLPYDFSVLFVDDGSRHEEFAALSGPTPHISTVEVLRLRRNLGHQRAIAIGLSFIAAETDADYAVVMDGEGEERIGRPMALRQASAEQRGP